MKYGESTFCFRQYNKGKCKIYLVQIVVTVSSLMSHYFDVDSHQFCTSDVGFKY